MPYKPLIEVTRFTIVLEECNMRSNAKNWAARCLESMMDFTEFVETKDGAEAAQEVTWCQKLQHR